MTDDALLSVIQRYVQEPVVDGGRTWALGLWNREEVIAYLAAAERAFIQRTQVVVGWQLQDYAVGPGSTTLDPEVVEVLAVSVTQNGRGTPCPLVSRHEADSLYPGWPTLLDRPRAAIYGELGTATLTLVPPPNAAGQLHLHVVPLPEPLTGDGDPLTVGDLWEPFIIAGALARMFAKPGQAYNAQRRDRANALFELGVALALQRTA